MPAKTSKSSTASRRAAEARDACDGDSDDGAAKSVTAPGRAHGNGKTARALNSSARVYILIRR